MLTLHVDIVVFRRGVFVLTVYAKNTTRCNTKDPNGPRYYRRLHDLVTEASAFDGTSVVEKSTWLNLGMLQTG
jgi:hypothetical protein